MGAKGKPKDPGSGRQKGTPNKFTQDLMAKCENAGVDVFEAMLQYVTLPCPMELRFAALKELASYLYPKRSAVQVSNTNPYLEMTLEELEQAVKDRINKTKLVIDCDVEIK